MDALSDVLRQIRLQGAFFLNGEFHAPWCVQAPEAAAMAPLLCPGAGELAILHMVLEGRCWIHLPGGEPIALGPGDVATLPRGDAHLVGVGLQHGLPDPRHAVQVQLPSVAPMRYGDSGERTLLVCGWFAHERDVPNPLLAALPRLFSAKVGGRPAGPWIEQSLRYALGEAAARQPGATAVAAKVAESLFVETVRSYIDSLPPMHAGWLAGLRDRHVGRCLALMHAEPARNWSVEALAREVFVSRSVLAERFQALVGVPPMQYLKRWRLALAARLLCAGPASLPRVAESVGYESEAAFSRAFKGEFGVAPGLWRSAGRNGDASLQGEASAAQLLAR